VAASLDGYSGNTLVQINLFTLRQARFVYWDVCGPVDVGK